MEQPLTPRDIEQIANKLAWTDGHLDEGVCIEYGVADFYALEDLMRRTGYRWDYDLDMWVSTRPVWDDRHEP